jgi:NAD(P)-dependent dehydrogenase (short-subunit alcohol dehydrogenase family)
MKVIVIGATGTIGAAVVAALEPRHVVVRASRSGAAKIDIEDPASIRAFFAKQKDADAVVCCAGSGRFKPLTELTDDDFAYSLGSKLMGQVNVARAAMGALRPHGSITLTTGVLATKPMPGSAAISLINSGVEGFVRAAALDLGDQLRINVVSPPWVTETLRAMKMNEAGGLPAAVVARTYVAAVEGQQQGQIIEARG